MPSNRRKVPSKHTPEAQAVLDYLAKIDNPTAATIKGKREYRSLYSSGIGHHGRPFDERGYAELEAWMLNHPGERLPTAAFMGQLKVGKKGIVHTAKKIEEHHGLPKRKPGGPNFALPKEAIDIIGRFYAEADKGSTIKAIDVIREVAKQTGTVISYNPITNRIKRLEETHRKSVTVSYAGMPRGGTRETAKLLAGQGIEVTGFKTRVQSVRRTVPEKVRPEASFGVSAIQKKAAATETQVAAATNVAADKMPKANADPSRLQWYVRDLYDIPKKVVTAVRLQLWGVEFRGTNKEIWQISKFVTDKVGVVSPAEVRAIRAAFRFGKNRNK